MRLKGQGSNTTLLVISVIAIVAIVVLAYTLVIAPN
jgi:hypothetical protein